MVIFRTFLKVPNINFAKERLKEPELFSMKIFIKGIFRSFLRVLNINFAKEPIKVPDRIFKESLKDQNGSLMRTFLRFQI